MKKPRIWNALEFLDDDLIEQADDLPKKRAQVKRFGWKIPTAAAACAAIAVGVLVMGQPFWKIDPGNKGAGAEGAQPETAAQCPLSYEGPILPLMIEDSTLTAERTVTFDFTQPNAEVGYGGKLPIQDSYQVTNHTDEEKTVRAFYPICGSYQLENWPNIQVNGNPIQWQLFGGDVAGGFVGIPGTDLTSMNVLTFASFEEYQSFFKDGRDLQTALEPAPKLEQPVIVYEVSNVQSQADEMRAATLALQFHIDPRKTKVLTYRFNGGSEDPKTGEQIKSFFIREGKTRPEQQNKYLIVQGEDIENLHLEGYENGACKKGEELLGVTADVTRTETTLGEALYRIAQQSYGENTAEQVPFELYYKDICRRTAEHSLVGENPKERYEEGRLDELVHETAVLKRVLYLAFDLTVPAGQSVQINVNQNKLAGYYYSDVDEEKAGINSYDLSTSSDGLLRFTKQTAVLKIPEDRTIVEQDFGFDPKSGVYEVMLDSTKQHYHLEIR